MIYLWLDPNDEGGFSTTTGWACSGDEGGVFDWTSALGSTTLFCVG